MRLTIIIPVHNEGTIIEKTLQRLKSCALLDSFSEINVVFIENGSSDDSRKIVFEVTRGGAWGKPKGELIGRSITDAGIGYAYAQGIEEAIAMNRTTTNDWLLLTACDLPFGFSDLESFIRYRGSNSDSSIVIGSKAHHESTVHRGFLRTAMTWIFTLLRRIFLGLHVGDTQGTLFVRGDQAQTILEKTVARDFFFSTEFCYHAQRAGLVVEEVPIVLEPELRPSSVRPVRDGLKMIRGILRVRKTPH